MGIALHFHGKQRQLFLVTCHYSVITILKLATQALQGDTKRKALKSCSSFCTETQQCLDGVLHLESPFNSTFCHQSRDQRSEQLSAPDYPAPFSIKDAFTGFSKSQNGGPSLLHPSIGLAAATLLFFPSLGLPSCIRLTLKYPMQQSPIPVTSPFLYGKRAAEKIIFQNQS